MKWVALLLLVGVLEMIGAMLVATSTNAFAQSPSTAESRTRGTADVPRNERPAKIIAITSEFDPGSLHSEAPRKTTTKRLRNRCARITTTCWSAA